MTRAVAILVLVGCALFGVSACSSKAKVAPPAPPTDLRGQKSVEIDARNNQFSPAAVIIDVGTRVTWRNADSVVHNVKKSADAVDFGGVFGIDNFNPGASYSFTFAKAGTFFYTCSIHTLMDGKIQVVGK